MCVCMCVCVCVCVCVSVCVYMCVYMCVYVCTCEQYLATCTQDQAAVGDKELHVLGPRPLCCYWLLHDMVIDCMCARTLHMH